MKEGKDFLDLDFVDLEPSLPFTRREFLKVFGGGMVLFFSMPSSAPLTAQERRRMGLRYPEDPNAYLHILEDGQVRCFTGKIEMGQGVITSLAQMLADELEVPLDSVRMVMGDTALCPWDMGTFGSMTTRFFGPALRAAAAEAREILREMAAEKLRIPSSELDIKEGVVFSRKTPEKRITYARLTEGKKIGRRLQEKPDLKSPSSFSIVGRPHLRRDAREKVTGKALFSGDIREPGMLYARILRPPAHGAVLKNADTSEARKIKGVLVVEEEDIIACLHEDPELAEEALARVKADYQRPEDSRDDGNIFEHLLSVAPEGEVVSEGGNLKQGEGLCREVIERTYLDGYKAHAALETHTALAKFQDDGVTVWASTQNPFSLQEDIASAVGLQAEKARIITPFVGGGFGGKTFNLQAEEAARLAKIVGRPVQVAWTRAEEFFLDTFRPAALVKIRAGTDGKGRLALWDYGVYFAGERGSRHFYDIPHHRTRAFGQSWRGAQGTHPFRTGAWRAPANNTNTFARESHIDILAAAEGMDPLEFRLKNLKDARMIRVLEAVAEKFGWSPGKAPSGRGYGIACGIDAGTYVAHMAEVAVDRKTGAVRVLRVACAQDMGLSINPGGAAIQMEGCITMGLGYALAEDIHFRAGEIFDLNFDTYEIPRFSWLPRIDTVIIEDREAPAQGGGEPAIICMGAVIANAIFDATGARLFQMPMNKERLKKALPETGP